MQIGGIITLILLTIGALWVVIRLGFGKEQGEVTFQETGLGKGYNIIKGILKKEDEVREEEAGIERVLHQRQGQELQRTEIATQAANQMRAKGITKENATALYIAIRQDPQVQQEEQAIIGKLEQDIGNERALINRLPQEQRNAAIEELNRKGKLLREYRRLQEQKVKKQQQIEKFLEGWQQRKSPEVLAKEQQELEQLLQELKATIVQEMQWHEKWKQEKQTQTAQLHAA